MPGLAIVFHKHFKNNKYEIMFNKNTGLEIMRGVNGHEDPFSLILPSLLDIGIMGTCKNKCPFCYQGHENKPNMKIEDFKTIIDQVKHHVNQVALGGRGDPNKHENFYEILSYCRESNVVPNYTTSGIYLTDQEVEISMNCGAVAVSEYKQDYTYRAIQMFIDAGIKTNIHLIFSKDSFDTCIDILNGKDVWQNKVDIDNLNAVIFLLFKPQGAGKNIKELIPTEDQYKTFSELVFKPSSKFKVGMDSCLVNHTLQYAKPSKLQRMSIDTCEGARMSAYITPDMKMMPCSFSDHSISTLITKTSPITNIWNDSTPFNDFRKVLEGNQMTCPLGL